MSHCIIGTFGKGQVTLHVKVDGKEVSPGFHYPWTKAVRDNCLILDSHPDTFAGVSRIFPWIHGLSAHTRMVIKMCTFRAVRGIVVRRAHRK